MSKLQLMSVSEDLSMPEGDSLLFAYDIHSDGYNWRWSRRDDRGWKTFAGFSHEKPVGKVGQAIHDQAQWLLQHPNKELWGPTPGLIRSSSQSYEYDRAYHQFDEQERAK